jgi:hypothetical protein
MHGERLAESKRALVRGDAAISAMFAVLLDSARSAVAATPISVMDKHRTPPSGDKHDYMSMAPYWWPDTTKPGGVPFIRRDGEMYPESRLDHDGLRLQKTIDRVETLALAYYLSGDAKYSEGAAKHLRVFFLDQATRMTPNLNFAQAVLGVNTGRGTGIIDTRTLPQLVDALRLLEGAPGWSAADNLAMSAWCRAYLTWMLESANGKEERAAMNNHGTFYDGQVVALALFVGDTVLARRTIGESARHRIDSQIHGDGTQPLELERTRPLHYSLFNLDAFTMLAEMGRHVGVDLWHYSSPDGGSLEKALHFVAPYSDATKKFPKPEIEPEDNGIFLLPLMRGAAALNDAELAHAIHNVSVAARRTDVSRFSFPEMP